MYESISCKFIDDGKVNSKVSKLLHITHNDADGIGCALVTRFIKKSIENVYFCDTGNGSNNASDVLTNIINSSEISTYTHIIISDVSIRDDVAELVDDYCRRNGIKLLMVDHHPTNKLSEKYDWVIMSKPINGIPVSAAVTLANHFNSISMVNFKYLETEEDFKNLRKIDYDKVVSMEEAYSYFITNISRYDTWEWKRHPHKNDECANHIPIALYYDTVTNVFNQIKHCILNGNISSPIIRGYVDFHNSAISETYDSMKKSGLIKTFNFHNYNTVAYLSTDYKYFNDIRERINIDVEGIDIFVYIDPMKRYISLRTEKPNVKVNDIASIYGGGGHDAAAGAANIEPDLFWTDILSPYYRANSIEF